MKRQRTAETDSIRALGYVRVSTGAQVKSGLGLTDQRLQIEDEVARRGWRLIEIVEDSGISGKKLNGRDAMKSALGRLDRGEADVLVAAKLDRISRSVQDLGWILDRASKKGWALVALDSDVDTTRASGRFVLQVIGAAAEYERLIIGERTAAAHSVRHSRGVRAGQRPILDDVLRQRVVSMATGGTSLCSIARTLNDEQVPTARGGRWYDSTIAHVVRSVTLDHTLATLRANTEAPAE